MSENKAENPVEIVQLRNEFYKDSYQKVMLALLTSVLIILILTGTVVYQVLNPPSSKYFAVNPDGRLIKLDPLDQPNMTPSALLQWANMAAIAAYTYSFVNYRQELQAASSYFTSDGWQEFIRALKDSGNLDAVIQKKLIVSAVAKGAPVISDQRIINGRYTWRVQMPMLITYQSASQTSQQEVIVTLLITRVSPLNSARGIGISQFIVASTGAA